MKNKKICLRRSLKDLPVPSKECLEAHLEYIFMESFKHNIFQTYFSIWLSYAALCDGGVPVFVVVYKLSSVGSFARLNSASICLSDFGFSISINSFLLLCPALAHAGTPTVCGVLLRQTWVVERLQARTNPVNGWKLFC